MPPCYSWHRIILTEPYPNPCSSGGGPCPIQDWFWITAIVAGVAVIAAHMGGK
jgi:hypothetical protein